MLCVNGLNDFLFSRRRAGNASIVPREIAKRAKR